MKLRDILAFGLTGFSLVACKKEQPAPPPPPVEVAAPVQQQVVPGMEAENPAEKEGRP